MELDMESVDDFTKALKADYLVEIYLPDNNDAKQHPYRIQRSLLVDVSNDFGEMLMHCEAIRQRHVSLSFPDDDAQSWRVLLFWIVKKRLPDKHQLEDLLLVRCWALGEKYGIADFQDEVMIPMLAARENDGVATEVIKETFSLTRPRSKLGQLMAEEVMYILSAELGEDPSELGLDSLKHHVGLAAAILSAQKQYLAGEIDVVHRFNTAGGKQKTRWKAFMVGDGVRMHGKASLEEAKYEVSGSATK